MYFLPYVCVTMLSHIDRVTPDSIKTLAYLSFTVYQQVCIPDKPLQDSCCQSIPAVLQCGICRGTLRQQLFLCCSHLKYSSTQLSPTDYGAGSIFLSMLNLHVDDLQKLKRPINTMCLVDDATAGYKCFSIRSQKALFPILLGIYLCK